MASATGIAATAGTLASRLASHALASCSWSASNSISGLQGLRLDQRRSAAAAAADSSADTSAAPAATPSLVGCGKDRQRYCVLPSHALLQSLRGEGCAAVCQHVQHTPQPDRPTRHALATPWQDHPNPHKPHPQPCIHPGQASPCLHSRTCIHHCPTPPHPILHRPTPMPPLPS